MTRARQLNKKVRNSSFLRHNFIFFTGALAIGALNYLYYPVLGRILKPTAFGEIQALVSIFLQISIFLTVLSMLTVNLVANHDDSPLRDRIIVELEKLALFISVFLLVLTIIFGQSLRHFLKFQDYLPFVILGLAVTVTVPFTFRSAYLRGKQLWGLTSLAGIVGAGAKLIFSVALVAMGLGTTGAILGIVLAQLVAFGYAALYARRHGFRESLLKQFIRLPDLRLIVPELKYAALVLTCSLAITGLYSVDIVVVKHYFDPHTAGLYAGISAVARIVFFLTVSITQVLMPAVRINQDAKHNSAVFYKSLVLLTFVGGSVLVIFWFAPNLVISRLMGNGYSAYANLLPRLSLFVFIISILNLLVTYHMALRRYGIALVSIVGVVASMAFLMTNHSTLAAVVNSLLYGSLTMFGALCIWTVTTLRQEKRLWPNS